MNTHVGWLISARISARVAVVGLACTLGGLSAWAQSDVAPMAGPDARRTELRTMVRQPALTTPAVGKTIDSHHLSAEERSQLRRQLTRELRAQSAAVAPSTRP
jgi:hypothetical protein